MRDALCASRSVSLVSPSHRLSALSGHPAFRIPQLDLPAAGCPLPPAVGAMPHALCAMRLADRPLPPASCLLLARMSGVHSLYSSPGLLLRLPVLRLPRIWTARVKRWRRPRLQFHVDGPSRSSGAPPGNEQANSLETSGIWHQQPVFSRVRTTVERRLLEK